MRHPIVTAIVSTHNSERFMRGCLEDLLSQTIANDLEIIVIDSGSRQDEAGISRIFASRHDNVRYFRTEQRESLYEAWNTAIGLAHGRYLTNANTDDRHRTDALERLVNVLEVSPEAVLAYGDHLISSIENELFDACRMRQAKLRRMPDFSHDDLMLRCITGPQPMWRRSVHEEYGLFNPRFRIAGDYEFWMRIAQTHEFAHVAEALGVFHESPNTLSGVGNKWPCDLESLEIRLAYLRREPWSVDRQLRARLAQELFGIGYQYVEKYRDMNRARVFLLHAWKLDPFNIGFAKTLVLRGLMGGRLGLR
jgi:glycosyltransferase involved in cell wall biosynthesis